MDPAQVGVGVGAQVGYVEPSSGGPRSQSLHGNPSSTNPPRYRSGSGFTTNYRSSIMTARTNVGLPDRARTSQANPIGNPSRVTRETAPMMRDVPPRVQHPKLNTVPWSTFYAVQRAPLPARKAKKVRTM
jgi:hypothetical protein